MMDERTEFNDEIEDPLGFTRQTDMILRGLNAAHIIPQFKMRNISTESLAKMTREDFMHLGADEHLADQMISQLKALSRESKHAAQFLQSKFDRFIEIIRGGEQQLSLIQAFVVYARLRLAKERINSFVDPDKNLQAGYALRLACIATLTEVENAEVALSELEALVSMRKLGSKRRYACLCVFGGVGLIALVATRAYRYYHC